MPDAVVGSWHPGRRARSTNQTAIGVRYQGTFGRRGRAGLRRLDDSGNVNYTGLALRRRRQGRTILGTTAVPGSTFNGKYDGLNFGSGGVAVTFAGFTLSANAIGGRVNGQGALVPRAARRRSPTWSA